MTNGNMEALAEDHTISDSLATDFSSLGDDNFDSDMDDDDNNSDDLLLLRGAATGGSLDPAAAAQRDARLQESLSLMDEFSSEKRTAKREARLKKLFKALSQYYDSGPTATRRLITHQNHIRMACLYSLRQGSPSEQYAACRCLEVTSVVVAGGGRTNNDDNDQDSHNDDEWLDSIRPYLERAVQASSTGATQRRATPVRVAALRAWATTVLMVGSPLSSSHESERLMDFCERVVFSSITSTQEDLGVHSTLHQDDGDGDDDAEQPTTLNSTEKQTSMPEALRAAALDSWALMATTIDDFDLAGQDDAQMGRGLAILEKIKDCLEATSLDLRAAAGECLSLIHEARLRLGCDREESENATHRRFRRGSWQGSPWEDLMDQVKEYISELSVESCRSLNKKQRKEQKATFRDFVNTIVDDESPEEVLSFRNGTQITLETWREIVQLNFVRHCLQSGLQIQLLTNPRLQIMFGLDGNAIHANGALSQVEKRLYMSKGSETAKEAHMDLTRRRDKKENIKNHFLNVDGEEF